MKICFVTPSYYPAIKYGGPIFSNLNLVNMLSTFSDIEVITSNSGIVDEKDCKDMANVTYFRAQIDNKLYVGMVKIWKTILNCDLVYIESVFDLSTILSLFWAVVFQKDVILLPRGSVNPYSLSKNKLAKFLWLKVYKVLVKFTKTHLFHFTSANEKAETFALLKMYKSDSFILPNLLRFETTSSERKKIRNRKLRGLPSGNFGYLGRINFKKRLDLVCEFIKNQNKDTIKSFTIVGNDDDGTLDAIKLEYADLIQSGKIIISQPLYGLPKENFLTEIDTFILISQTENFANVVLEALEFGNRIVTSDNMPWAEFTSLKIGLQCDTSMTGLETLMDNFSYLSEISDDDLANIEFSLDKYSERYILDKLQYVIKSNYSRKV